jgi:cation diffusion facilitator CzcD-associated flavoprotein CzcO
LYNADIRAKLPAPEIAPYPIFAKRPANETHSYEIFNQPNVTLIDLRSDPIRELTPSGLLTESALHHLDILILATGFDAVHGDLGAISITGLDTPTTLGQSWKNGKSSYLGLSVARYPNLFYGYGP